MNCFRGNSGNPMNSMFQTPAMQNLMQQMSSNPGMFQNMMQSPYMQDMMQRMVQNPELMASVSHSVIYFIWRGQLKLASLVCMWVFLTCWMVSYAVDSILLLETSAVITHYDDTLAILVILSCTSWFNLQKTQGFTVLMIQLHILSWVLTVIIALFQTLPWIIPS